MAQDKNPGNFANDREKASEAGRKGGERSHGGQPQQSQRNPQGGDNRQQGGGNFAQNPGRASEAGRKGGQQS